MDSINWPSNDDCWKICENMLADKGATDQQKSSFNAFINRELHRTIYKLFAFENQVGLDLSKTFCVKCNNVVIKDAILLNNDIETITPSNVKVNASNARLLRSSIVSPVYLTLEFEMRHPTHSEKETIHNMLLCYVPIMVGSCMNIEHHVKYNICDDGYFILGGNEKCIITQERKIDREVLVTGNTCIFKDPTFEHTWCLELKKSKDTQKTFIEIITRHGACDISIIFAEYLIEESEIYPQQTKINTILWKERSPKERLFCYQKAFPNSEKINIRDLFHQNGIKQLVFMAYCLSNKKNTFSRDHIGYKRVENVSELLLAVLEKSLIRVVQSFKKRIINFINKNPGKKMIKGVSRALDSRVCTEAFFYSLSTGNWPSRGRNSKIRTGVAQSRSNYNFSSMLSQARRIHTGDEKRSIIDQREVRGEHFGFLSPYDTAEGKSCGINKHFATLTTVSIEFDDNVIMKYFHDKDINTIDIIIGKPYLIIVNGCVKAQVKTNNELVVVAKELRQYRRVGIIDAGVSILLDNKTINIRSDAGRILRPLFVLSNLYAQIKTSRIQLDFQYLINQGIIEYIDAREEDSLQVAANFNVPHLQECSHAELHPTLSLSMNTNTQAPYCNHNQGPRITYQNAMAKQSQSELPPNYKDLFYTRSHYIYYGQKPLANTKLGTVEGMPDASGFNAIVAIMPFLGYNQEDSIIVNQHFLDRGGYRTLDVKTFSYSGSEEISKKPAKEHWKRSETSKFKNIDDDGLPTPGNYLHADDIILSKCEEDEDGVMHDTSVKAKDKHGIVSRVVVGHGRRRRKGEGEESAKVNIMTYEMRIPEIGDKFASRHAQKGVISMVFPEEDLPFIACGPNQGVRPDIIMSPHAIPTRMTIGHLLECFASKLACHKGKIADATAFADNDLNSMSQEMKKYGFNPHGDECLIDGRTGEMMTTKIFMGPVYYQRLRHMVSDKIHIRTPGAPRSILSKQPVAGRGNGGGHRLGEMESTAIAANGAALVHKSLWAQSDKSTWKYCSCGAYSAKEAEECISCKSREIKEIEVPYTWKLLCDELRQCGIKVT